MTYYDIEILTFLADKGCYVSPTEVGEHILESVWMRGKSSPSSWASPKLKSLERAGLVRANAARAYKITKAGRDHLNKKVEEVVRVPIACGPLTCTFLDKDGMEQDCRFLYGETVLPQGFEWECTLSTIPEYLERDNKGRPLRSAGCRIGHV